MYMVKRDFWSDWGIRNASEAIVDMEEIEDSAGRWYMTVDDLLEEVEEVVGADNMEQNESTISYREVRELGSDQLMVLAMDYYYGDNTGKKAQSEYDSHFDIPDEVIYEHYSGIEFVPEDFGDYDWGE